MADLREVFPATADRQVYAGYIKDRCPFHRDHRPSLLVWPHRYECKACGAWGTEYHGQKGERSDKDVQQTRTRAEVPNLSFDLAIQYHATLNDTKRDYYHGRGLADETIRRFLLGYGCPPDWDTPRYAIPIIEGRDLLNVKFRVDPEIEDEAETDKKYIGIAGHNHAHLWGIDGVPGHTKVIIVGGEIDRIHAYQDLFPEFHPVTGTGGEGTWSPGWTQALRSVEKLYVCLDGDKAGQQAQTKLCRHLRDAGLFPIPVRMPENPKDVDSFLQANGADGFKALLPSRERLWFMACRPTVYWRCP